MGRAFRVALALVLLCIIGSASFICYKVFFSNPSRSIPLLKGSSVIEAVETLERMGVKARIEEEESNLPRGTVIGQWPETGVKLRADKVAILKVSRGAEKRALPDVRKLPQDQAVARLQEAGFIIGEIQKINHDSPVGVVIAQSPSAPVSVPSGRNINLLVSLGPAAVSNRIEVPDLRDRDEETAKQIASENGLKPHVEYVYDLSSPQGMVISMSPEAGREVRRGSDIRLRVASWSTEHATAKSHSSGTRTTSGARVSVVNENKQASSTPASAHTTATTTAAAEKPSPQPAQQQQQQQKASASNARQKIAKIRYQAPPVKNQTIRIELIDKTGEHTLLERKAAAGEYISINAPYVEEAVVTVYLGGEFVWQDRFK